jgi:hypothetical protein
MKSEKEKKNNDSFTLPALLLPPSWQSHAFSHAFHLLCIIQDLRSQPVYMMDACRIAPS